MWFYQISALEGDYRIVAPDAYTLQGTFAMDDVCNALIQILGIEGIEKAIVIGLSAGGGVAQLLLQEHPERVEHVVFSHCGILERSGDAEKQLAKLLRLVRLLPLFVTRRILLRRTTGTVPTSSKWVELHNGYFREAAGHIEKDMIIRFLQSGLETRRSHTFKPEVLASWPGKILLLGSKDDTAAFGSLGKLQARYPNARTHVLEEGGHHTFMFFPEAYTAALKTFLDDVRERQ